MKSVALLSAKVPDAVPWLLEHMAQSATSLAGVRCITVHAGVPGLSGQPPRYHAVLQVWHDAGGVGEELMGSLESSFAEERYAAEELVTKAPAIPPEFGITPRIASLSFIRAKPALSHAEVLRHWTEHAPLACEIHWGMTRYVQNRFGANHGMRGGWFGMAYLHFPHAAALRDGLFRTVEDRPVIAADVAEFVDDHATMLAVEHVIRA